MHFRSILLFIFQLNSIFCSHKKSKGLENYVIDVIFSNTLTIIRCNPYEVHIFRELSIEILGHLRCTNRNEFLPDNHIENITLLQWTATRVHCKKKSQIIDEEETIFLVKHKPKYAFKKIDFKIIRLGSTGRSDVKIDDKKHQIIVKHPTKNMHADEIETIKDNLTMNIYAFRDRPILCSEKLLMIDNPCANQYSNLSVICYYRIGLAEPPTYAEMENEIESLSRVINLKNGSHIDQYINNRPDTSLLFGLSTTVIIGIIIGIVIIIVIIIIVICCCCCCDNGDKKRYKGSDTSNIS